MFSPSNCHLKVSYVTLWKVRGYMRHGQLFGIQWINSVAQSCPTPVTPWTAVCQASLFANSRSLLKHESESVMPSNRFMVCHPLLLLPLIFPSIRVFSNESVLHIRWPKCWNFSFNISPSNIQGWFPLELAGLISLQSKGLSRVFPNITIWKHQFFSAIYIYIDRSESLCCTCETNTAL